MLKDRFRICGDINLCRARAIESLGSFNELNSGFLEDAEVYPW